ncbi:hypothetical protein F9B85_13940 [Heliorestis acidaminivorans]|uniref:Uncharacterized protein n=1 Tax=Heliorestis acidaminivorans TaxID=553427 RepID=A0A6I0EX70_9FIRM|nr:hypothetical protein [Heliorestis acidaminivorans]KAB2950794.1 hypothetical protein F9B85_13940 [Heliorestis acidaminivorans]
MLTLTTFDLFLMGTIVVVITPLMLLVVRRVKHLIPTKRWFATMVVGILLISTLFAVVSIYFSIPYSPTWLTIMIATNVGFAVGLIGD